MTIRVEKTTCTSQLPGAQTATRCFLDQGHQGSHRSSAVSPAGGFVVREWTDDSVEPTRCPVTRLVVFPLAPEHEQRCRGRVSHKGPHWSTEPDDRFVYRWLDGETRRVFAPGEPRDLVAGDFDLGPVALYAGEDAADARVHYRRGWNIGVGKVRALGVPPESIEDWLLRAYRGVLGPEGEDGPVFDRVLDGYYDAQAGREDGHSKYCRHHGDGADECGVA